MQGSAELESEGVERLFAAVFEPNKQNVFTSDSDFGEGTRSFASATEMYKHLTNRIEAGTAYSSYAIHYLEAAGHVEESRVNLDPSKCNGHSFRHSVGGWGIIHIQLTHKGSRMFACHITVNSEKRAAAWFSTYPEFKEPSLWRWRTVEQQARRLLRKSKVLAQQAVQPEVPASGRASG